MVRSRWRFGWRRGRASRIAALAVVLILASPTRGAGTPATYYWRGNLDTLRKEPARFVTPRPVRAGDRIMRVADSLYRVARARETRPVNPGRSLYAAAPAVDTGRDTVLVLFRDREATEFARQVSPLSADSTVVPSREIRMAQERWDKRVAKRLKFLEGRARKLAKGYNATVIRNFQLAAALVIELPRSMRDDLARRSDVMSIQSLLGAAPFPTGPCGSPDETPPVGARTMGLDRFRAAGFGNGRLALLDTGMRSSHALFAGKSLVEGWVDCEDSLHRCLPATAQVDVDGSGHGTATAAILVGRNAAYPLDEGVTGARLTSYKVYRRMGSRYGLFRAGAGWAFEDAILRGFDVIVTEIADTGDARNLMTRLACEAFDRGAIVVAAGGNDSLLPLPSPASAPRILAVGAHCVHDRLPIMAHSRGRTRDGRVKPEIGAPTSVYTAGNESNEHVKRPYGGTSGATPFAAAAALYLKNWMGANGARQVWPGEVYAMMLACGEEPRVHDRKGTGFVRLPAGGTAWWGRTTVGARQAIEIPLPLTRETNGIEAAIWWPEYGRNGLPPERRERAVIALQIASPAGLLDISADPLSCFQRASLASYSTATGRWTVTIAGESLPRGAREVYWAAWAKPAP